MGARGTSVQPPPGPPHRAQPAQRRHQRRPGAGARRRPAGRGDRRDAPQLRRHARQRRRSRRRCRSPARAAGRGGRGDRQALPRPRRAPRSTPTSRYSGSISPSGPCGGSTRRRIERFVAAGGDLVMISSAIYPAFSRQARPRSRARSRPASCAAGSASTASRSPTRSAAAAIRAVGGARPGPRVAAAKAGTDLLLFSDYHDGAPRLPRPAAQAEGDESTAAASSARSSGCSPAPPARRLELAPRSRRR